MDDDDDGDDDDDDCYLFVGSVCAERERERERANVDSSNLFYKDCDTRDLLCETTSMCGVQVIYSEYKY